LGTDVYFKRIWRNFNECQNIHSLLNKKKYKFNLCLDVGHGDINSKNKSNYDPYKWLINLSEESPVIHIKQVQKNNFSHLPFTKKNNKKGIIDPKKVLDILKKRITMMQNFLLNYHLKKEIQLIKI
jgi:hypothetical protein